MEIYQQNGHHILMESYRTIFVFVKWEEKRKLSWGVIIIQNLKRPRFQN
jgi:hypothetical protein